jgi:hypothetical protein
MAETKVQAKPVEKVEKKVAAKPVTKKVPLQSSIAGKNEIMQKHAQMVWFIQNVVGTIESELKRMKLILAQLAKFDPENPDFLNAFEAETKDVMGNGDLKSYSEENMEVVEGKFDGYFHGRSWSEKISSAIELL